MGARKQITLGSALLVGSTSLVTGVGSLSNPTSAGGSGVASNKMPFVPGTISNALAIQANVPQQELYEIINGALQQTMPESYGGTNLDSSGQQIVHIIGGPSAIAKASSNVVAAIAGVASSKLPQPLPDISSITYVDAQFSLDQLNTMTNTLSANHDSLAAQGVVMGTWGVDITTNRLRVSIVGSNAAKTQVIQSLVASSAVEVASVNQAPMPMSRQTDGIPWYGGDLIGGPSGAGCTSGFPMMKNGGSYNATTAHCGNGAFNQNGQGYGVSYDVHSSSDLQLITTYPGSAIGVVWTGSTTGSAYQGVQGVNNSQQVGGAACNDGYQWQNYGGTGSVVCGSILLMNQCANIATVGTICGLNVMTNSGQNVVIQGDSGGPVLTFKSNGVEALGMSFAGAGNCSLVTGGVYGCTELLYAPEAILELGLAASAMCGSTTC